MGRSLVRAILAHGDQCTAVGWTEENTPEQMDKWQNRNCLGLLCDVRVRETVDQVIKKSIEYWGQVDVIANSTGYGVIAACEDQDDYDLLPLPELWSIPHILVHGWCTWRAGTRPVLCDQVRC